MREDEVPTVAINIVRYNQEYSLLEQCLSSALDQQGCNFTVTLSENGSSDSIEEDILIRFGSNLKFRYIDNGRNLGFAGANNRFFSQTDAEFVMPLNPDTVMEPTYLQRLMRAFQDPAVAAAEGKMVKPERLSDGSWVLDGTGMTLSRARKAHERGQLEIDRGQYDQKTDVFGVSGTAAVFRKSALERIKHFESEYFDEDFFTYWEDLDLSWRLRLAGFSCAYVPDAVIYHSRFAGQSKHGFRRPWAFAAHTRTIPTRVLRWDWRNHLFAIIKNDFGWPLWRDLPFTAARELLLLGYFAIFEPRALGAIPEFVRLLPRILKKRTLIQRHRRITSREMSEWLGRDAGREPIAQ
jgi:GT2 family glycosyltransferase